MLLSRAVKSPKSFELYLLSPRLLFDSLDEEAFYLLAAKEFLDEVFCTALAEEQGEKYLELLQVPFVHRS
jgi:hypothetical protein